MVETTAKLGFGVMLQRESADSPSVYQDVGEIIEQNGPTMSRDSVEATHSESPNRYREFISGLRDGGEVTATIALVPSAGPTSVHALLVDDFNNDESISCRVLFPDGVTTWTFSGFLTSLEHATPIDDRMTLALTVKVSGQPVLDEI